jgi:hypothetical protein
MKRNPETVGVSVGLAILVAGGFFILLPALADLDPMAGGIALQFAGFFLVLVGGVVGALYGYRAFRLESMFRGRRLLAYWHYGPAEVEAQAERELRETRQRNFGQLLIVAVFLVACTLLFVLLGFLEGEGDSMPLFVAIMAGVFLVVAAFALGMPYAHYRRARESGHEVIIAENGLYAKGALHTWNVPLSLLDAVTLDEEAGQAQLVFHLRSLSRTSITAFQAYTVEVPVPPGEEETARRIEAHFESREETG